MPTPEPTVHRIRAAYRSSPLGICCRSRPIMELGEGFSLWQIGADRLAEFSLTVYETYDAVYGARDGWRPTLDDFFALVQEDVAYQFSSLFLAAVHSGEIVATSRVTRREPGLRFPIETVFGVDLDTVAEEHRAGTVYHVGRTVIHKRRLASLGASHRQSARLLETLYRLNFELLAPTRDDLFVGEVDEMMVTILRRILRMPVAALGPAQRWGGAMTVPIVLRARDIPVAWTSAGAGIARAAQRRADGFQSPCSTNPAQ